ncbi:MAG: hypothetical protein A3H07_05175 [Candidatus Jacksonbacteria bacterium RIFCSPLOWO2_12_FULL_44_15b]|nr:MAG: hypothetical protein A3H07_05175 [Candidatus Jacksonbacteria bacterium RIFCSPLOWO2_12_FULL_44_15b]
MINYRILTSIFLIILLNTIILVVPLQVRADAEIAQYELDETTIKRGYPAQSFDRSFTLLISPGSLREQKSASVEIREAPLYRADAAYHFQVMENGAVSLLKKPFTVVFLFDEKASYARLYYYYAPRSLWLALTTTRDKTRGILFSNRVDFGEGIIGLFSGNTPLQDTILAEKSQPPEVLGANTKISIEPPSEPFTAILDNDILKQNYNITLSRGELVIPKNSVGSPSTVTAFFDESVGVLDFVIKPFDPLVEPLNSGAFLQIILNSPKETNQEQTIAFWDNNTQSYRALQTMYSEDYRQIRAQTPFHFGRYTVISREGVYRGDASWFRDSLLNTPFGAASNDYPKGERIRVTNTANGKSVDVEVRSTGPFVRGRIIDLTKSAFTKIANPKSGIITVRVERVQ